MACQLIKAFGKTFTPGHSEITVHVMLGELENRFPWVALKYAQELTGPLLGPTEMGGA